MSKSLKSIYTLRLWNPNGYYQSIQVSWPNIITANKQKNLQKVAIVIFTDQQFNLKERIKWRISKPCWRTEEPAGDHPHRHSWPDNSRKDLCMKTGGITQMVFSFLVCSPKKLMFIILNYRSLKEKLTLDFVFFLVSKLNLQCMFGVKF